MAKRKTFSPGLGREILPDELLPAPGAKNPMLSPQNPLAAEMFGKKGQYPKGTPVVSLGSANLSSKINPKVFTDANAMKLSMRTLGHTPQMMLPYTAASAVFEPEDMIRKQGVPPMARPSKSSINPRQMLFPPLPQGPPKPNSLRNPTKATSKAMKAGKGIGNFALRKALPFLMISDIVGRLYGAPGNARQNMMNQNLGLAGALGAMVNPEAEQLRALSNEMELANTYASIPGANNESARYNQMLQDNVPIFQMVEAMTALPQQQRFGGQPNMGLPSMGGM